MKNQKVNLLTWLSLLAILLAACSPAPQSVADKWQSALNSGDIDAALSYLAEDADVSIVPAGPDGDGVYHGHAEIRGWYQTIVGGKGAGTLKACKTEGATLTCVSTYADEGLKSMGVDFIEGEWVAVVSNGKIQSYKFTITPESLAKFPPPPAPEPAPTATALPTPIAAVATLSPEVRITTVEAIVGNWLGRMADYKVLHEFKADGTLLVNVSGVGLISRARYWFEGGLLKIEDLSGDCMGIVGSYETYATYQGDQPVQLHFVLNGGDTCSDRRNTLAGKTMLPSKP